MTNQINKRILVVGRKVPLPRQVWSLLQHQSYVISFATDVENALNQLNLQRFDMVMTDAEFGLQELNLLETARRINPDIVVLFLSPNGTVGSVLDAIRAGTVRYFRVPCEAELVIKAIDEVFAEQRLVAPEGRLPGNETRAQCGFAGMIAKSPRMRHIFALIERVSDIHSTVLISGETGVGKELVARAIHFTGARRKKPFVAINCGALTETLLESELFGHDKGAFTGAFKTKPGKFESAHNGTLFLDEIGDISASMQVKLLRALQEKKVERVGGTHPITVDVRVIAATNQNLKERIRSRKFRIDLFYRLNVIPIHVPALRERPEDIPPLAEHFLDRLNRNLRRNITEITPRAIKQLMDYHWPGNVRELENVVEGTYITCDAAVIDRFSFPQYPEAPGPAAGTDAGEPVDTDVPFSAARSRVIETFEKTYLIAALERYRGNIARTSQATGIHQRTLWRKLKEYGLDRNRFKGRH